jgi:WD40 repeat protein
MPHDAGVLPMMRLFRVVLAMGLVLSLTLVAWLVLRRKAPHLEPARAFVEAGHDAEVDGLAFHPDGLTLVVAISHRDTQPAGVVRFYRLADGVESRPALTYQDQLRALAISPDGTFIALGFYHSRPRLVWLDGSPERPLGTQPLSVLSIDLSSDGQWVVTSGTPAPTSTQVWRVADGSRVHGVDGHSALFSPDATLLAVERDDRAVELWRTADWTRVRELHVNKTDTASELAFSPDGTRLAALSFWKMLRLWRVSDGALRCERRVGRNEDDYGAGDLSWAGDGATVFATGRGSAIEAFDGDDGALLGPVTPDASQPVPTFGSPWARFSGITVMASRGSWLAAGDRHGAVASWQRAQPP